MNTRNLVISKAVFGLVNIAAIIMIYSSMSHKVAATLICAGITLFSFSVMNIIKKNFEDN
ncbi:MAG: hypothetical protein L7U87_02665 [Chlamydiales bacterium]|nr:hypothetical protein [Chlamydiales bacterium]